MRKADLIEKGFKPVKQYDHDQYFTSVLNKGILIVEITEIKETKEVVSSELSFKDDIHLDGLKLWHIIKLGQVFKGDKLMP